MALGLGWASDAADVFDLASRSADRAIALDPLDARALTIAGHVKAYLLRDVRTASGLHAKAIELNANLPIAWTLSAWTKIYGGDHSTALRHAQAAISLSPRDPHIFFAEHALMQAHFFKRELIEADILADSVLHKQPDNLSAMMARLAILGHLDRREEGLKLVEKIRTAEPRASVAWVSARPPLQLEDREYYAEGLRKAGLAD